MKINKLTVAIVAALATVSFAAQAIAADKLQTRDKIKLMICK